MKEKQDWESDSSLQQVIAKLGPSLKFSEEFVDSLCFYLNPVLAL